MAVITIDVEDLPGGKFNGAELIAEIAAAASVSAEDVGYAADLESDHTPTTLTIEVPDGTDAGAVIAAVSAHDPELSEIEEEEAIPTVEERLADLEARVALLEAE